LSSPERELDAGGREWMRTALHTGWRELLAADPPGVFLATIGTRVVLQALFFTLLGDVVGGAAQREYAFVGISAAVMCTMATVAISEVPAHDKQCGTMWRIRMARRNPAAILALRAAPYPAAGLALGLLAILVAGPLAGLAGLTARLLPLLPIYVLMALTASAAGFAGAALSAGKRADVLVGNLLAYLILLAGGAFLPPGRVPWVDAIGTVLPMRHGLAAVHAALAGQSWAGQVLAEAAVGVGWAAAAWAALTIQFARARHHGHDDFD